MTPDLSTLTATVSDLVQKVDFWWRLRMLLTAGTVLIAATTFVVQFAERKKTTELSAAKSALSDAKEEQIRQKLADRNFTTNERAAMVRILSSSPKSKLRIRYLATEPEAGRFAKTVHAIFVEAGWNPEPPTFTAVVYPGVSLSLSGSGGVQVLPPPPPFENVRSAFKEVGIETGMIWGGVPDGALDIWIGKKP